MNNRYFKSSNLVKFAMLTSTEIRNVEVSSTNLNNIEGISSQQIQNNNNNNNYIHDIFSNAWMNAIKGNFTELNQLTDSTTSWDNPYVSTYKEYLDGISKFASYFVDPSLNIFNVTTINENKFQLEYQLSFFYPMPWRPRIIIPGTVIVETSDEMNNKVLIKKVVEKWDYKVFDIVKQQFFPRFWDIFHLFNTPSPEYPPYKVLGQIGPVEFIEISPTLTLEIRWRGLANQPGPPLQVIPDFALFGDLKTSKIDREEFYTVLPPEVQSGKYTCPITGNSMKQSSWFFHVPTNLREQIIKKEKLKNLQNGHGNNINNEKYTVIDLNSIIESDEETPNQSEIDYAVGYENIAVMPSLTKGTLRGNYELNMTMIADMRANEKVDYIYKYTPKRIIARTSVNGNAESTKITKAFQILKSTAENTENIKNICKKSSSSQIKYVNPLTKSLPSINNPNANNWIGLQLYNTKVCFSPRGQPGMAIYEIQFQARLTKVFIELEFD